jgi:transposase InsO family protein
VRRIRRKRLARSYTAPQIPSAPNQEWAIDFASDVAASGQRLRIFSVVDALTRDCLALEYNRQRPHSALGYRTPEEFAANWAQAALPSECANTTPRARQWSFLSISI